MLTSFLHPRRHPHLHVSPAVYGNQGARAQACSHPPPLPIFLHHPYIYAPPVPISPPLPVFTILQPSSIYVYCSPLQESCGGFSMRTSPTPNSAPTFHPYSNPHPHPYPTSFPPPPPPSLHCVRCSPLQASCSRLSMLSSPISNPTSPPAHTHHSTFKPPPSLTCGHCSLSQASCESPNMPHRQL